MKELRIKLHLKNHCIETAAKKKLRSLTDQYYNSNEEPDNLLKEIEFLQGFIEQSNFSKLRSDDERLSGDYEVFVDIFMYKDNYIIEYKKL
ncbi:MAG: hypothetical protein JW864_10465 [Spirochaetes bacterium]|nr:hypothetical protein [Spirochaetota bacterium]